MEIKESLPWFFTPKEWSLKCKAFRQCGVEWSKAGCPEDIPVFSHSVQATRDLTTFSVSLTKMMYSILLSFSYPPSSLKILLDLHWEEEGRARPGGSVRAWGVGRAMARTRSHVWLAKLCHHLEQRDLMWQKVRDQSGVHHRNGQTGRFSSPLTSQFTCHLDIYAMRWISIHIWLICVLKFKKPKFSGGK